MTFATCDRGVDKQHVLGLVAKFTEGESPYVLLKSLRKSDFSHVLGCR